MQERLQKILSARGIASRRKAEEYIVAGLVKVNGEVASLGDKADPDTDEIEVDGKVLQDRKEMIYYLMHKPVGVVTSNVEKWGEEVQRCNGATVQRKKGEDGVTERSCERENSNPEHPFLGAKLGANKKAKQSTIHDKTVRELLPPELQGVIYPVGRLDKDSSGLLLFTNDGPLAYRLTHPKFFHEKEYAVMVNKLISDEDLQTMAEGMVILGEKTKPTTIRRIADDEFTIALTEGKNRQIRRMCEKLGYRVKHLMRIRIVNVVDDILKPGEGRMLEEDEKKVLLRSVEL